MTTPNDDNASVAAPGYISLRCNYEQHVNGNGAGCGVGGVAALFVTRDSIYKDLGADCYDIDRDALSFPGGKPIVAHPPCRAWASLRHCAKAPHGERELALWAVQQVRQWGGVLEHPLFSVLWREAGFPRVGGPDEFGGFTLIVDQYWWGHRAQKRTRLYICGLTPRELPPTPIKLGVAPCTVGLWSLRDKANCRPSIGKKEFAATPRDFARWLLSVAGRAAGAGVRRYASTTEARCNEKAEQ